MFFMTTVMITCTVCGRNYKRCTGGKRHFWNCPTAVQTDLPSCGTSQIPEKLLYDLAAEVLGLAQFDEGVFLERVKGIDALPDKTLVFNFKDGSTAERHWENISRVKSWTPEMKEIARQRALRKEGVRNGKSRNGHSTDKYRRTIWRCNSKFTGEEKCQTPHLTEDEIKARFLDAFNALVTDKERLLDECRTMQAALTDTGSLDSEIAALLSEMEVVAELTKRCIEENSTRHRTRPLTWNATTAWQSGTKPPRSSWRSSRRQRPSGKPRPRTSAALCSNWRSTAIPSPSSIIDSGSPSSTP